MVSVRQAISLPPPEVFQPRQGVYLFVKFGRAADYLVDHILVSEATFSIPFYVNSRTFVRQLAEGMAQHDLEHQVALIAVWVEADTNPLIRTDVRVRAHYIELEPGEELALRAAVPVIPILALIAAIAALILGIFITATLRETKRIAYQRDLVRRLLEPINQIPDPAQRTEALKRVMDIIEREGGGGGFLGDIKTILWVGLGVAALGLVLSLIPRRR